MNFASLKTPEESCAATINAGTDLEMGTAVWNRRGNAIID